MSRQCRKVLREFSETKAELIDLPNQDEQVLRRDLESLGQINFLFGAQRAVESLFREVSRKRDNVTLVELASGYGDHGRNIIEKAKARNQTVTVIAVDRQIQTLRIARQAKQPEQRIFFVQADIRHLPFRNKSAEIALCSLALHHFTEMDAVTVLQEMKRIGCVGVACVDLARSRLATWAIWLLTACIYRKPMARHDARLPARRAFFTSELRSLAKRAGWNEFQHRKYFCFQQGIHSDQTREAIQD